VWYRDTFDRECPPQIELSGCGLARGLVELWARWLFESVQADGSKGFSHFWLWWRQSQKSILIDGDREGARRLRHWVFGNQRHTHKPYSSTGDWRLLQRIAFAHAWLILSGEGSGPVLAMAGAAADRQAFEAGLSTWRD
jgi:hypothetical protein